MDKLRDNMTALRAGSNGDLMAALDRIGKPYAIYAEVLERSALEQFLGAMAHGAATRGALMPDAHMGYSLPIGGVVATDGAIFPSFVGYDIGCGMVALPISTDPDALRAVAEEVFKGVYSKVPVGFEWNQKAPEWTGGDRLDRTQIVQDVLDAGGLRQIGSLGSGNHFIEIGADDSGQTWIVCHSGSRNLGHRVASHYMQRAARDQQAVEQCFANYPDAAERIDAHNERMASENKKVVEKAVEGCFGFSVDNPEGIDYLVDMAYGLEFALANRREIVSRVAAVISKLAGGRPDWDRLVNRNHNHAELSADGLWVHRKGATHAEAGMMGVIPGNMRDGSFIVKGLGNGDSLCSSSHGAGRVLSRSQASKTLNVDNFRDSMGSIVARIGVDTLDESPDAYKDIFAVMAAQEELVEVVAHSHPIINIKGFTNDGWKAKNKAKQAARTAAEAARGAAPHVEEDVPTPGPRR